MMWYGEAERGTRVVRFDRSCVGELSPRTVWETGKTIIHQPPRHTGLPPGWVRRALPNWQWVVPTRHYVGIFTHNHWNKLVSSILNPDGCERITG